MRASDPQHDCLTGSGRSLHTFVPQSDHACRPRRVVATPLVMSNSKEQHTLDEPSANWTPSFKDAWKRMPGASVVVFLVALPLCLGVALACGAPLMSGILPASSAGLSLASPRGSHLMVSGPVAGLTAIVLAA